MIDYFEAGISDYHNNLHKPPEYYTEKQKQEWYKGWNQEFYRNKFK